jgi:hypothetical protein
MINSAIPIIAFIEMMGFAGSTHPASCISVGVSQLPFMRKQTVLTTRPAQVICPSGGLLEGLSSLFFGFSEKYLLPPDPNQI